MRSEEIEDLLERVPIKVNNWILGIIISTFLIMIGLSLAIDYPDVIQTDIRIVAQEQPYNIISQSNGQIVFLFNSNNAYITSGTPIGYIVNSADYESVLLLKENLVEIIKSNYADSLLLKFNSISIANLGELNPNYYSLSNATSQYFRAKNDSLYILEQDFLEHQIIDIGIL
jgi:hypothetical protein